MLILSPAQLRAADAYTIENEPISSINLMERACRAFVAEFVKSYHAESPVFIFCGTGNNGGDGLGVARVLYERGIRAKVFIAGEEEKGTADFKTNLKRLEPLIKVAKASQFVLAEVPSNATIIDGLFGSGLNRPLDGEFAQLVEKLNSLHARIVSIDTPSGLFCEQPQGKNPAIRAQLTITFQAPKLSFLQPENYPFVGEWKVVDIGLSKAFLGEAKTPYYYQQVHDPDLQLVRRHKFAHKGDAGRVLLVAGSRGKTGAAILAAKACMRTGAGLLTVHTSSSGTIPLQTAIPEAMVSTDDNPEVVSTVPTADLSTYQVVAAGPGLGTSAPTVRALHELLSRPIANLVLDADALNILSINPDLVNKLPRNTVLTPHPGEFQRLVGKWSNDFEKLDKQTAFATAHQCIVVLKGAFTSIASAEGTVFFNSTGNPGMATGGSGDVLTGIIAGFIAQGVSPLKSARLAVLIHGLSGDLAAAEVGEYSLIASDLVDYLPLAIKKSQQKA